MRSHDRGGKRRLLTPPTRAARCGSANGRRRATGVAGERTSLCAFWRAGGGEVMGFLVAIPCLMIMLAAIVTVIRVGIFKQTLEYAAYKGCRAAIECGSMEGKNGTTGARDVCELVAGLTLQSAMSMDDVEDWKVDFDYANGVDSVERGEEESNSGSSEWKKGQFVTCTVSAKMRTFGGMFNGTKHASITMMIERPASGDGDEYEWFRGL